MNKLEELKVNTPDINKVKNDLAQLWNNLARYNLRDIPKYHNLSSEEKQIVEELFNKSQINENTREKIYSDLCFDSSSENNEELKSRLYSLITNVKQRLEQNKYIKAKDVVVGELHHIAKEAKAVDEETKIY